MAIHCVPTQRLAWKVELPWAYDLRKDRVEWCRSNIVSDGSRPSWIPPFMPKYHREWYATIDMLPHDHESWFFAEKSDAVMFDMVWNESV